MQQPLLPEPGAWVPSRGRRLTRLGFVAACLLVLATARCTFPEYGVASSTGGGGSGQPAGGFSGTGTAGVSGGGVVSGGTAGGDTGGAPGAGRPAMGGSPDAQGADGGAAGTTGGEAMGGAPECAPEQWPVSHCSSACLHRYPDHCYDGKRSEDELDIDCGGGCQLCTNETCTDGAGCLSGQCAVDGSALGRCYAPLSVSYTAQELSWSVSNLSWSITLSNDEAPEGEAFVLKDLELRYYFARKDVVEPILMRTTQSVLRLASGEMHELRETSWTIERTENKADVAYDAYVAVRFRDSGQFFPGNSIGLYQQMVSGDTSRSNFDQRANYSFTELPDAPFLHVSVLYQGRLLWGLEPRPANPRQCFARGVNLNGPALKVDDHPWEASVDAQVSPGGGLGVDQANGLYPPVTGSLATLLKTAFHVGSGNQLELPTENGTYLLYLYAVSPASSTPMATLTIQGEAPEEAGKFRSQTLEDKPAWARLGPFRTEVSDGKLRVGVTGGAVNLAGIELWYPE